MWPPIRLAKAAVEHVLDLTRLFLPRFLRAIKIPVLAGIFSGRYVCHNPRGSLAAFAG